MEKAQYFLKIWIIMVIAITLLESCNKEETLFKDVKQQQIESSSTLIDEAKAWFDTYYYDFQRNARVNPSKDRLLDKLKKNFDWDNASIYNKRQNQTIEVPISFQDSKPGINIKFPGPTDKPNGISEMDVWLIIKKSQGEYDASFLVITNVNENKDHYGYILKYSIEAELISALEYKNGQILNSFTKELEYTNARSQSSEICILIQEWLQRCVDWYDGNDYIDSTCEDWDLVNSYSICYGNGGGGSGGSSGGTGSSWSVFNADSSNPGFNLCSGNLNFVSTGFSHTAEISGLGLSAVNYSANPPDGVNAELGNSCITIPDYATDGDPNEAAQTFSLAFNLAREQIQVLLNSGDLYPLSYNIRVKLIDLIRANLPNGSSFTPNPCSGNIPISVANYSC